MGFSKRRKSGYLVFHASWAAFTLILAVSSVKGGKGGRDPLAMTDGCADTNEALKLQYSVLLERQLTLREQSGYVYRSASVEKPVEN